MELLPVTLLHNCVNVCSAYLTGEARKCYEQKYLNLFSK